MGTQINPLYQPKHWFNQKLAAECIESLKAKGFIAYYAQDRQEATDRILGEIPNGASVGIGGSVTLRDLGIPGILKEKGYTVYDHWDEALTQPEKREARNKQVLADVFLSGTNAVCLDGTLVNADGSGNRVSSMIFGPKITIVVCGVNKIVGNLDEAFARIRQYAAPVNARRLGAAMPCQNIAGYSSSPGIKLGCRVTTIIEAPPMAKERFVVVVVNEDLGY